MPRVSNVVSNVTRARKIDIANRLAPRVRKMDGVSARALVERAERSVEARKETHRDWAGEQVEGLRRIVARLAVASPREWPELLGEIARTAAGLHDVGGTIGWSPLGHIGRELYEAVSEMDEIGPRHRDLIAAHVDALASVLYHRITDDSSPDYRAVSEELARAWRRLQG